MALPRAGEINRTNKLKIVINLINGECLEEMKSIPSESIDAIITDPPYGTTACKWDSVIDFDLMWEQLNRIIKPNGAIVLFGSEPFSSALRISNIKNYKYDWKYHKVRPTGVLNAKIQPLRNIEDIVVFYKKQSLYNPQGLKDCNTWPNTGDLKGRGNSDNYGTTKKGKYNQTKTNYPKQIISNIKTDKNKQHPTQKPVALMEYLIKTYTNECETVLDFTMGSGSTGVACVNAKRNFIGIEQDESYFNIATDRINNIPKTLF